MMYLIVSAVIVLPSSFLIRSCTVKGQKKLEMVQIDQRI